MIEYFTSIAGIISVLGLVLLTMSGYISENRALPMSNPRLAMQIILSLVITAAGLFVILSQTYSDDAQKWAFGAVGTILGYWLPLQKVSDR